MVTKISDISTEAPGSTSDLIGNIGSTSKRFRVEQVLGVPITAEGDLLIGDSSNMTTRLAAGSSGQILGLTTGVPTWQADPSTGHITTAGTSGQLLMTTGAAAAWVGGSSGSILYLNSSKEWKELAIGTSGYKLQSTGGFPAIYIVAVEAHTIGMIRHAGMLVAVTS